MADTLEPLPFAPFGLVPRAVLGRSDVSPTGRLVWALLATYANADGGAAFPARATLATLLGVSVDTIDRATRELVANGLLDREERVDAYGGTLPALYRLAGFDARGGGRTHAAPGAAPMRPNQTTRTERDQEAKRAAATRAPAHENAAAADLSDATYPTIRARLAACGAPGENLDAKVGEIERTVGRLGRAQAATLYRWLGDDEDGVADLVEESSAAERPAAWLYRALTAGATLDRRAAPALHARPAAAPAADPDALARLDALRARRLARSTP